MNVKPLPCPWCKESDTKVWGNKTCWVSCSFCRAEGPVAHRGRREAIILWNRALRVVVITQGVPRRKATGKRMGNAGSSKRSGADLY